MVEVPEPRIPDLEHETRAGSRPAATETGADASAPVVLASMLPRSSSSDAFATVTVTATVALPRCGTATIRWAATYARLVTASVTSRTMPP